MFVRKWIITAAIVVACMAAERQAVAGGSLLESSFTFQGKAAFDGIDLNDTADFEFTLWDDLGGNNQIGAVQAVNNVDLIDGLFSVELDFGTAVFDGGPRFIEIALRSPAGAGLFTTLDPRQPITATPYAVHADSTSELVLPAELETSFSGVALSVTNSHPTTAVAIEGVANNNNSGATGVSGIATGGTAETKGVLGTSSSINGVGVLGEATAGSGTNKGVWGMTNSPDGFGGFFEGKGYFSGNVGIGTANPNKLLTVNGGGLSVYDDAAQGIHLTTNQFTLANADNEDPVYSYNHPADQHEFFTDGSQRLTITADGDVGIGTTGPFARLDVRQSVNSTVALSASYTGPSGNAGLFNASNASNAETALSAVHAGTGKAFLAYNYGTGKAAEITIDNPINNSVAALEVNNNGFGFGIDVNAEGSGIRATATDEESVGVIASGRGVGVNAVASDSGSVLPTFGGIFQNASLEGAGVYGAAGNPNANGYGVHGKSFSTTGNGVYGENDSPGGAAILGEVTNPTGVGAGIVGRAPFYGVVGEATGAGIGVSALATSPVGGDALYASSTAGRAIGAFTSANNVLLPGVLGQGPAAGVRGIATANSGLNYGVYGQTSSTSGYAGYFEGRGHFSGDVGIGALPSNFQLYVQDVSTSRNVMNLQRAADAVSGSDLIQMKMGAGSDDDSQFIECERGTDFVFRVWGDGDVSADGVFTPGGADYAEMVRVTSGAVSVSAGDVMVIDVNNPRAVVKSQLARSTLVAGIYSTQPGVVGSEHDWDEVAAQLDLGINPDNPEEGRNAKPMEVARMIDEVPVAVVGIVPCNVSAENGAIRPGDLLVTSDTPGHAMRDDNPRTGTVVGKAMGSLDKGTGSIRVLVTLQ